MKQGNNNCKKSKIQVTKRYKLLDNFHLKEFNPCNYPEATKIYTRREDVDLPEMLDFDHDKALNHTKKLIREYAPWEISFISSKTKIPDLNANRDINTPTKTELKNIKNFNKKESNKGLIATIITIIILMLAKAKGLVVLIFAKVIPFIFHFLSSFAALKALFITGASMILSILAYASVFKLELALGLVFLIFIHEMGHAIIINLRGIPASMPVFIPFFGAMIMMKGMPKDAITEAQVAIGGPLLGTCGAILMFLIYQMTEYPAWLYLAYIGFFMNLFNLTPVKPLDGGRIVSAISTKIWIIGLIILFILTLYLKTPVLMLVFFFALMDLIANKKERQEFKEKYYNVSPVIRGAFVIGYFGLVIFLTLATYGSYHLLNGLKI